MQDELVEVGLVVRVQPLLPLDVHAVLADRREDRTGDPGLELLRLSFTERMTRRYRPCSVRAFRSAPGVIPHSLRVNVRFSPGVRVRRAIVVLVRPRMRQTSAAMNQGDPLMTTQRRSRPANLKVLGRLGLLQLLPAVDDRGA